jgi:ATP-binding cassette subfamily D (ALD) protein 3
MNNLIFYRANNIGTNRLDDIDQRATADLKKFSSQFAELYGNLLKPSLEVVLLSRTLGEMMGYSNLMGFFAFFVMAGQWLRVVMPAFAKIHAEIHGLEGDFRSNHFRVMEHSEEIAFYGGSAREREIVNSSFRRLTNATNNHLFLQMMMSCLDSYVGKNELPIPFLESFSLMCSQVRSKHDGLQHADSGRLFGHPRP